MAKRSSRGFMVLLAAFGALSGVAPVVAQQGYVLDGFGGIHAINGAPVINPPTPYFGFDAAESIEVMRVVPVSPPSS